MSRPRTPELISHVTIAGAGPHCTQNAHLPLPENPWPLRCKVGRVDGTAGCDSVQTELLCRAGTWHGRVTSHLLSAPIPWEHWLVFLF